MDPVTLRRIAVETADELPGSECGQPFGPQWDVYKVRGKVFLLLTEQAGPQMVTVKAHPEDARALVEAYADVAPGYHMNKRHWVSLTPGDSLDEALVHDAVVESYLLVVEGMPRAQRPVDPATYAGGVGDSLGT